MRDLVGYDLENDFEQRQPDLLEILARRRGLIALTTALCAAFALAAMPLMPKKYDAHCTIFARSKPGLLNSLSVQFPSMPLNLLASSASPSDYLAAILRSDAHARRVARHLRLRERPEFVGKRRKPLSEYRVVEKLKKSVLISDDRRGSLRTTAVSRSPVLAARIANEYAAQLRASVSATNRKKRDFISRQLDVTEQRLDDAAQALKEFQDESRAISLDEQTKAAISALADLQGQLMAAQVELREVESGLQTGGNPAELARLKSRKPALDSRIRYLESSIAEYETQLAELPGLAMRLAQLRRDVEVQQKIYEVLTEQYQLASIAEESDDDMFEVVDPATPAEKPCSPKLSVNLATGLLFGLVLGSFFAVRSERRGAMRAKKLRETQKSAV